MLESDEFMACVGDVNEGVHVQYSNVVTGGGGRSYATHLSV